MPSVTVAIDCMGGDYGPSVTVPATFAFLRSHPRAKAVFVGREEVLTPLLEPAKEEFVNRVSIFHAEEVVEMHEHPTSAMKNKKKSSMRLAIDLVKAGEASAAVSAGNTGALMAIARFVLKMLPGIDRPAIATTLPTIKGRTIMLDLGANVNCTAEHLLQFGVMGAMTVAAIEHKERPTVGLLNIGEEEIKGSEVVKQAAELLRASGLNFYGNVEGDDIFRGTTDVVVCDGFVGNVSLKTTEGLAQMLTFFLREEFSRNIFTKLAALLSRSVLKGYKNRVDHRRYNGAVLVGLRGVVVKSHGSADVYSFEQAITRAAEAASNRLIERITERMSAMHEAEAS